MSIPEIKYLRDTEVLSELPHVVRLLREGLIDTSTFEAYDFTLVDGGNAILVASQIASVKLIGSSIAEITTIDTMPVGHQIYLFCDVSTVTVIDSSNGSDINLSGDPNDPDFPMQQGDVLVLSVQSPGIWTELYRAIP